MDNDPCKFVLSCRGSSERFTLQAANTDIKQVWVQHISELLDAQSNFLSGDYTLTYQLLSFTRLTLKVHLVGMSGRSGAVLASLGNGFLIIIYR